MRVLAVSPASWYSTADVFRGLCEGFEARGDEVAQYRVETEYSLERHAVARGLELAGRPELVPPGHSREDRDSFPDFFGEVSWRTWRGLPGEILRHGPDLLLFVSPLLVPRDVLVMVTQLCSRLSIRTAAVFTESPYDESRQLRMHQLFDHVFVNDLESVPQYRAARRTAAYLPTAYSESTHKPYPRAAKPAWGVSFIGVGFKERIELLESVDWSTAGLSLWGDWSKLSPGSPLAPCVRGGVVPNELAAQIYRDSAVCLNLMRSTKDYWGESGGVAEGATSLNPRAYEIAACGTAQVCEYRPEWVSVFGEEMLSCTFRDAHGMLNAILELLADPDRRRRVADAQMAAVIDRHSYRQRADSIAEVVR